MNPLNPQMLRLKQIMVACALSQKDLSNVLGVTLNRVKSLNSGRVKNLTQQELSVLTEKHHVSANWLVQGTGSMFSAKTGTEANSGCMKFNTTFTRCRDGKPLMELDGQPFNGLEIRPTDLRRLGETLMWLADLGTALPTDGRNWKPTKVEVDAATYHSLATDPDTADVADRPIQFVQRITRAFNNTNQG